MTLADHVTAAADAADGAARSLISAEGLDRTLFVEAGAGTGKTTQLVDRVVALVLRDVAIESIAAITFTEAAASELQARLRVALERRVLDETADADDRERCRRALVDVDRAAISTVHGFASRLLSEFSISAGLPPEVTIVDPVGSQLAHEARWERFVDQLHADGDIEPLLDRALLLGIPVSPRYPRHASFKDVALNFAQNWDRLIDIASRSVDPLPEIRTEPFDASVETLADVLGRCTDRSDLLFEHICDILDEMRGIASVDDPRLKLQLLRRRQRSPWKPTRRGRKTSWSCPPDEARDLISAVNRAVADVVGEQTNAVIAQLTRLTAGEVVEAARLRQRSGTLEYHDLLVLARQMLRSSDEVRRIVHDRYRHLLLDEFQDTDPLQIELATLIASIPGDRAPLRWQEHTASEGRLFFVGDPKQSIYRFRRADIKLFLDARRAFTSHEPVALTTNFRTIEPIIEWVNGVFDEAMPEERDGIQPRYRPLTAWRRADSGADHRPVVLGGEHPDPKVRAGELREAEAADVAALIDEISRDPAAWPVHDRDTGRWRPATAADITILIPTRTSLPYLRDALDRRDIPYRLATGTLVYDTQEVRDLLSALRAIDDPGDARSLVAALRSPLYACSDVDLAEFHLRHPSWDLTRVPPTGQSDDLLHPDHPVVRALAHLRSLWQERWWLGPADLLDRLVRERHAFILGFSARRPHEVWRRLRFLLDQARMFEANEGAHLRRFLEWAALQSADGARVHEPLLPETDDDAVQILTVHGAKGLEFPITILSGMTTRPAGRRSGVSVIWPDSGPPSVKLDAGTADREYDARADLEDEMDHHEKLRLLYVAATRARDHLVVSGHHKTPKDESRRADTFAGRLAAFSSAHPTLSRTIVREGESARAVEHPPAEPAEARQADEAAAAHGPDEAAATHGPDELPFDSPGALDPIGERDAWIAARRRLSAQVARPVTLSATAVAHGSDPTIVDVDDDAAAAAAAAAASDDGPVAPIVRRKGRAGSAIGRAVHATLEFVDLDDPRQFDAIVRRECRDEAIAEQADTVAALARSALASDAVALARLHPYHRELYVAAEVDGITIEGYVDLLIETPDGLVVVDYKTDAASTPREIDAKLDAYELQGAAYALALEASTGIPVIDCRFVFCRTRDAVERSIADLAAAKARVRSTVTAVRSAAPAHTPDL